MSKNLKVLKEGGRLVIVGLLSGADCRIDLSQILRKRIQIKGSVMRSRSIEDKREITNRFKKMWLPHLISGKIRPIIDSVYPLEKVKEAHERMEANQNFGKICLEIN